MTLDQQIEQGAVRTAHDDIERPPLQDDTVARSLGLDAHPPRHLT